MKKYEMDVKRAITLINMPKEWFNTPEKIGLYNQAVNFLKSNSDIEIVKKGDVQYDAMDISDKANDWFEEIKRNDEEIGAIDAEIKNERETQSLSREYVFLMEEAHGEYTDSIPGMKRTREDINKKIEIGSYTIEKYIREISMARNDIACKINMLKNNKKEMKNSRESIENEEKKLERFNSFLAKLKSFQERFLKYEQRNQDVKKAVYAEYVSAATQYRDALKRICAQMGLQDSEKNKKALRNILCTELYPIKDGHTGFKTANSYRSRTKTKEDLTPDIDEGR